MTSSPLPPGLEKGSSNRELSKILLITALFMPSLAKWAEVLRAIAVGILGWVTTPLEMFLRVEHGERTLSPLRIMNSFLVLQVLWIITYGISYLVGKFISSNGFIVVSAGGMGLHPLFQAAFLITSFYHLWRISYRRRKGIIWHSMSSGISILEEIGLLAAVNEVLAEITVDGRHIPYRVSRWTIYLYIEPLMGLLIAEFMLLLDVNTGIWLIVASVALFFRNHLMHAQQRALLLDYQDSQIDAEYFRKAARQETPKDTAGVQVIPGFEEAFTEAEDIDFQKRMDQTFSPE